MEGKMTPKELKKEFDIAQNWIDKYDTWNEAAIYFEKTGESLPPFLLVDDMLYINRCLKLTERKKCPSR